MKLDFLEKDRFLRKDANQNDSTKGAVYTSVNPAPKRGEDFLSKIGRPKGSEEDDGAPNILTGTVITSCFIQTSALPSRIEMQGNDLTFYDDTYEENGRVIGDTSRIIFTHDLNSEEGFIVEKRASIHGTYDNVLSFFATPAKEGYQNYIFIGREGNVPEANVASIHLTVSNDSELPSSVLNGIMEVEYAIDGVLVGRPFSVGDSKTIVNSSFTGMSAVMNAASGGIAGLSYNGDIGIYMASDGPNADWLILGERTTNLSSVGAIWYYKNGSEGLRMRITGFNLQFDATIV